MMNIFSKDFKNTFFVILLGHVTVLLISYFGLPSFKFTQRPDLIIELSSFSPSKGGDQPLNYQVRDHSKVEEKMIQKDQEGLQKRSSPQQTTSQSSMSGPAAAPTVDADYKATYLKNPKPPYPPLAVQMRLEGKVLLLVEVLPNGRAGKVALETSSGHDLLDQSALQTVKQWQFLPAKKDGAIVRQVVRIPINFNLKSQ